MKLHQISVFLENRPGQLKLALRYLAEANINLSTLSLADSKQFGILRLITPEWEKAEGVFKQAGFTTRLTEVLAVEVPDRPGGLLEVLDCIEAAEVNVEYMYAFSCAGKEKAVLIFRFDDPDRALAALQEKGISLVGSTDLFERS